MCVMLVNLLPHPVDLYDDNGVVVGSIPVTGRVARCRETRQVLGVVDGVKLTRTVFQRDVDDLPGPRAGTYLIVSRPVAEVLPERDDLVVPDELVRNERGEIVGCRSLCRCA